MPWDRKQVSLAQKILDRYAGTDHLMIQPKGSLCARRADGKTAEMRLCQGGATITAKRLN